MLEFNYRPWVDIELTQADADLLNNAFQVLHTFGCDLGIATAREVIRQFVDNKCSNFYAQYPFTKDMPFALFYPLEGGVAVQVWSVYGWIKDRGIVMPFSVVPQGVKYWR